MLSLVFIYRYSSVIIADIELPVDRGPSPMVGDHPQRTKSISWRQKSEIGTGRFIACVVRSLIELEVKTHLQSIILVYRNMKRIFQHNKCRKEAILGV